MWIARLMVLCVWIPITIYDFVIGNTSAGVSDIVALIMLVELTFRDYVEEKEAE